MSVENWERCEGMCEACPFAMTEISEQAQNYGCLPSPYEVFTLMKELDTNWSCHEQDGKLCAGYIAVCKDENIPYKGKRMFATETWLRTGEKVIL